MNTLVLKMKKTNFFFLFHICNMVIHKKCLLFSLLCLQHNLTVAYSVGVEALNWKWKKRKIRPWFNKTVAPYRREIEIFHKPMYQICILDIAVYSDSIRHDSVQCAFKAHRGTHFWAMYAAVFNCSHEKMWFEFKLQAAALMLWAATLSIANINFDCVAKFIRSSSNTFFLTLKCFGFKNVFILAFFNPPWESTSAVFFLRFRSN